MKKIIKNKKTLLLILFIIFIPLLGFKLMAAGCATDCTACGDEVSCNASLARCQWDTTESECCHGTEIMWPPSPAGTQITGCSSLTIMVKYFYEWGITLGGLAAFISLIIAGFQYLTSVGNPARMQEAKNRAIWALGGLALLLGSWLLLNTINPQLTTLQTAPFEIATSTVTGFACDNNASCTEMCITLLGEGECFKYYNICKIAPGFSEGMCFRQLKPCDYAVVYSAMGFNPADAVGTIGPDEGVDRDDIKAIRAFYGTPTGNPKVDAAGTSTDESAGGCTAQLFAGGWFFGIGCGDRMATIPAYESNLYRWVDRPIKCVRLIQPEPTK